MKLEYELVNANTVCPGIHKVRVKLNCYQECGAMHL